MLKQMLTIIIVVFLTLLSFPDTVFSQVGDKNAGIGLMLGEPTGITYKNWTSDRNAFDLGLAWSFGRHDDLSIHADYLWHKFDLFNEVDKGQMLLYYGIGGRLIAGDNAALGARVPVGLNYLVENAPVGIFFEIAPIVDLAPDTELEGSIILGGRYYF